MASLEYLTHNSLTAYPFKGRVAVGTSNPNPIQDSWFLDILFISYTDTIRGIYISRLEKTVDGELLVTFNNSESLQPLQDTHITIPSAELVDHLHNGVTSFASYSSNLFAVKFVFGSGIVEKEAFTQTYTLEEAELTSAAIILRTPDIDNLTFESYEDISQGNPTGFVKNYTPEDEIPVVSPNYNTTFTLTGVNEGRLDVFPGAGKGLYNDCPNLKENVYSVNQIFPDLEGALFLKTTECYTSNVLSNNDVILYGQYLDPYKNFVTHMSDDPADDVLFDAVSPQHSIVLENFCRPKCPPENMSAFAYYLNRVTDGAIELDKIISKNEETHGNGTFVLNVFTANSFCVPNNPFIRCVDPVTGLSNINCSTKFIKYFHEGRTLQLYYNNLTIREYTIVEVLDDNTVRLDSPPTIPSGNDPFLFFRLIDNGVISNVNCAVRAHNQQAATFTTPYFKVKYTTTESFNSDGIYVTYLAVSLAIFNPSSESHTLRAFFTPTALTKQGDYKIRTEDTVNIVLDPVVTISCREYAFIEAIFYIACEETGGSLEIKLFDIVKNLQIGEDYIIPNVNGAPCLSTVAGKAQSVRIKQSNFAYFTINIPVSSDTTSISEASDGIPQWLRLTYDNYYKRAVLAVQPGQTAPTSSAVYNFSYTSYAPGQNTLTFVTVDYVANPIIISPLASKYSVNSPLVIAKNLSYSLEEPVFKVFAKNMTRLTGLFPSDADDFFYTLTGTLPPGLAFDEVDGTLSGQVDPSVTDGTIFNFTLNAVNPSGPSTAPQNIYLAINIANLPAISFIDPPENNIFEINNALEYTGEQPIYSFEISGGLPTEYVLEGSLIEGLFFNSITGKITGKATYLTNHILNLSLYAKNANGKSNTLEFKLNYTVYAAPEIVVPYDFTEISTTTATATTPESPLFTVEAKNLFGTLDNFDPALTNVTRNSFTATNLPTGLFIDQYTGKVYGKISTALLPNNYDLLDFELAYNVVIFVTNPVGRDLVNVILNFSNTGLPKITNIAVNSKITATRAIEYTKENPLFKIVATGNPTEFSGTGLPENLVCDTTDGSITGKIQESTAAGEYSGLFTATNQIGTSPTAIFKIIVPLAITYPANGARLSLNSGIDYNIENPVLSIQTTGVNNNSNIIFTATSLPEGLSLSGNKIIGRVASAGNFSIRITANSLFGSDSVYVNLSNDPTYSLSGNITGVTLPDGLKIKVEDSVGSIRYVDIQNNTYTISNLIRDTYYLQPNPEEQAFYNQDYSFLPKTKSVSLIADKTNQNFTVSQYHSFYGKIIFPKDNEAHVDVPIEGVTIDIGLGTPSLTLSDGTYTINRITVGTYRVAPTKQGYTFTPSYRLVNAVAGNYRVTNINFNLQTVQTISGAIFNSELAKSIPDVTLTFRLLNMEGIVRTVFTNNNGLFTCALAPDKTYRVTPAVQGVQFFPEYVDVNLLLGQNQPSVNFSAIAAENIAPSPPTITNIIVSYRQFIVEFNPAEVAYPGPAVLFYEYSLDNGETWTEYTGSLTQNRITITQLQDDKQYDVRIRAVNIYSRGGMSNTYTAETPGVPDAPSFYISPTNSQNTLVIRWQTPQNGGSPILGYKYSLNGGQPIQFPWPYGEMTTREKSITSLTFGQTNTVKLLAYNLVGDSVWADEKSVQVCVRPDAPTITSITTGDNSVAIYFTPNNTGGGILRKTRVLISSKFTSPEGFAQSFVLNDVTSPIELSGNEYNLYNGYEHDIILQTGNDYSLYYYLDIPALALAGYSPYSNTVTVIPARAPDAPIILSSPKSNLKLVVRYAIGASAPYDGGSPVTDYLYSLNGGAYISTGSTAYPIVITQGIVNNVEYTIRIKSVNIKGTSPASEPIVQTPNPTVPEAPIIETVSPGNGQIILNVGEMPADGGFPITGYLYNFKDDLPQNYVEGNVTLYTENQMTYAYQLRPLVISGLNNGQTYTVRLKLKTSFGVGPAATVLGKPVGLPSPATITDVVPGDGKLTVTFTPPEYDGGAPITNYSYELYGALIEGDNVTYLIVKTVSIGADATTFEITDITNYYGYAFILFSSNGVYSCPSHMYGTLYPENRNAHPFGKPAAPTINITVGSNKLTVNVYNNFIAMSGSNGRRITALKYVLDTAAPITLVVPNPENDWRMNELNFTFDIPGLVNDQEYTLKVAAVNEAGAGAYSDSVTATPKAPPGAPTILSVVPRFLYARVYYTPPINTGKPPILGYVFSKHALASTEPNNPAISIAYLNNPLLWTKETVTGNFNLPVLGSTYTGERLGAKSISGVGDTSPLGDITMLYTTPDELIIDTVTPNNTKVKFLVTSFSSGGHNILDILFSLDGGGVFNSVSNLQINYLNTHTIGYTATFDVTGLQNNISYNFIFKAVNDLGEGEKSQLVSATPTPQAPPSGGVVYEDPSLGYSITTTSTSLSCLTYVIDDGGASIYGYKYRLSDDSPEYTTTDIVDNIVTFSGLVAGSTVTIQLAPINSIGVGAWSSLPPTIIAGPPVIQLVSVTNGDGASEARFGLIDTGVGSGAYIRWLYDTGMYIDLNIYYELQTGLYKATFYGSNTGIEVAYSVKASNGLKDSNILSVPINPAAPPSIINLNPYGYFSGGTIAVSAIYDSGGRPLTKVKGVAVPENEYFYDHTYTALVSSGFTPVDMPYNDDGYSVNVNFENNQVGRSYKIYLFLYNVMGYREYSNPIILASEGAIPTAPSISFIEPGPDNGVLRIHYYFPTEKNGYGNSAATGLKYRISPGDGSYWWQGYNEYTVPFYSTYSTGGIEAGMSDINVTDMFSEQEVMVSLVNPYGDSPYSIPVRGYPGKPPAAPEITEAVIVKNRLTNNGYLYSYLYLKVKSMGEYGRKINGYVFSIVPSANTGTVWQEEIYTRPNSSYIFDGNDRQVFPLTVSAPLTTLESAGARVKVNMLYEDNAWGGSTYQDITFRPSTVTYLSVPEPVEFSVTEGDKQYTLTYETATVNGGALVTGYQYSQNANLNSPSWTNLSTQAGQVFTRTGLNNGTTYNIAVRAINSATTSLSSVRNFKVVQITPATTPAAPTINIISGKDRAISISFFVPSNTGGAAITNYQYSTDGGANYVELTPADALTPITISRASTGEFILNNTTYSIALRAVNRKGAGLASQLKSYTVPIGKASEPNLTVTSTKTSLTISYTAPANNGGAQVTGYKYSVALADNWNENTATWIQTSSTPTPITIETDSIPGLAIETGQTYKIAVRAITSAGEGFIASVNKTAAVPPNAPYLVFANKSFFYPINQDGYYDSQVYGITGVCYYPTDTGGSAITSFEVSINDGVTWHPGQSRTEFNLSYGVAFMVTSGVTIGGFYKVRCRFINAIGAGAPSNQYIAVNR